jgi:hypothetical protein
MSKTKPYAYNHCYEPNLWLERKDYIWTFFNTWYKRNYGKTIQEMIMYSLKQNRFGKECTYWQDVAMIGMLEQYLQDIYYNTLLYKQEFCNKDKKDNYHVYNKWIECMKNYWYCKQIDIQPLLNEFGLVDVCISDGVNYMDVEGNNIVGKV